MGGNCGAQDPTYHHGPWPFLLTSWPLSDPCSLTIKVSQIERQCAVPVSFSGKNMIHRGCPAKNWWDKCSFINFKNRLGDANDHGGCISSRSHFPEKKLGHRRTWAILPLITSTSTWQSTGNTPGPNTLLGQMVGVGITFDEPGKSQAEKQKRFPWSDVKLTSRVIWQEKGVELPNLVMTFTVRHG